LETFLAPFFGVLVAFIIQWAWVRNENTSSKEKLLKDINKELTSCSQRLVGEGNLLPIDIWKSAVSSGSLKLISHDHKFELASIYFRIECHNYEAEKVRDVSILAATDKDKARAENQWLYSNSEKLHIALSNRLIESEKALHSDIDNLLKQKIWS
jgi:hypothetical protein